MQHRWQKLLDELDLKPEQRATLERLKKEQHGRMAPVRKARHDLMEAVADGVQAGNVDVVKLTPQIDALTQSVEATKPGLQEALNEAHRTLTPAQRSKLVAELSEHGPGALALGGEDMGKGPAAMFMKRMGDELGLTTAQRQAIRTKLEGERSAHRAGRDAIRAKWQTMAKAFETPDFDAKRLDIGGDATTLVRTHSTGMIRTLNQVLPELTPEQRTKAATAMRSHGRQGSWGGQGPDGGRHGGKR
jgi:Spy/CpxP family protein refolding chaperone